MSHNPYTSPSSHVDDYSAAVDADGNRDVLLACKLIWASFATARSRKWFAAMKQANG